MRRAILGVLALALVAPAITASAQGVPPMPVQTTAFERVWQRADLPVATGRAERSWTWGPKPLATTAEVLVDAPDGSGKRLVQYFDKSRMEINDPRADANSPWYVSNGLLVVEMISGRLQVGSNNFEQREPAQIPVAGDTMSMSPVNLTPTYAALVRVASLAGGQNRFTSRIGQPVTETLGPDGTITPGTTQPAATLPKMRYYEPTTGHNVADVFYDFMNSSGTVYENGQFRQGPVFNWVYAMGYPITEPYWITIEIQGRKLPVLMQAFQRRLLTYNPANAPQWRVEMGNVGMQYYMWRYNRAPQPGPAPTPGEEGTLLSIRRVFSEATGQSRSYSAIHGPLYTVVSNQSEWLELWRRHASNVDPAPAAPAVNFAEEMVIGAWWGDRPNGCSRLDIEGAQVGSGTLRVTVNQRVVSGGCTDAITQPHDIVAVKIAALPAGPLKVAFVDPAGKLLAERQYTRP